MYPHIPVGGRLKYFLQEWEKITDDQWVLSTIQHGLKLDLLTIPPWSGVKETFVNAQNLPIILSEVESLLEKGAIEAVHPNQIHERFLQYVVSGTEKNGRYETSHKSPPSQQLHSKETFSHGYAGQSSQSSATWRLGDISRPQRCVFAHTSAQGTPKISSVLHTGQSIPICSPVFRPIASSSSIHKNRVRRSGTLANAKCAVSLVSGRLATCECSKRQASSRSRDNSEMSVSTRGS